MTYIPVPTSSQLGNVVVGQGAELNSGTTVTLPAQPWSSAITPTIDNSVADEGLAPNLPNSPNYATGLSSTAQFLQRLNILNADTEPT